MNSTGVIVTGGAGYIGSHTIVELIKSGYEVISLDNYFNSDPVTYDCITDVTGSKVINHKIDLRSESQLKSIIKGYDNIAGVIHFAALKSVPDSVQNPGFCFDNNTNSTRNIATVCLENNIRNLLFSSSCSVYGNVTPEDLPVMENTPLKTAQSPYAFTKQSGEKLLEFMTDAHPLRVLCLRYFNPVGAHISGELGELPAKRVNNLVPIIAQTADGLRDNLTVFGGDWNTRDGSCIRDYIHVSDIAKAHVLGLSRLIKSGDLSYFDTINLGSGEGVSVLEAIDAFVRVNNIEVPYEIGSRRPGDVEAVYSNPKKAKNELEWEPSFTIDDMMRSAWKWQKKLHRLGIAKTKL